MNIKNCLRIVDSINHWVAKILSYDAILIMVIMLIEMVSRYIFHHPTIWAGEVVLQLFMLFIVAGGYTLLTNGHVRMDAIYSRFSPKRKAIMDVITSIMFLMFAIALLWKGSQMAAHSISIREHSYTYFAPPLYPIKTALPLAAFLLLIQGLAKLVRDVQTMALDRNIPADTLNKDTANEH